MTGVSSPCSVAAEAEQEGARVGVDEGVVQPCITVVAVTASPPSRRCNSTAYRQEKEAQGAPQQQRIDLRRATPDAPPPGRSEPADARVADGAPPSCKF